MVRYLLGLVLSLALFFTREGAAQAESGAELEGVRTGSTELTGPAPVDEPPAIAPDHDSPPPADAPRATGRLTLPPVAAGFSTYDGGWIRFTYHPSARARLEPLIAGADRIRAELAERLGAPVLEKVRVDVGRTPGEMKSLAPEGAPYPSYAAGVAYSQIGLVLLTLTPPHAGANHDLEETFRHELAHVALYDAVGRHVPRWFNEGFAVLASGETSAERLSTLWTATLADNLLPLSEVERTFPSDEATASIAYAQAVDVVRFLVRREERHRFHALIEQLRDGDDLDRAVRDAYGVDLATLEQQWREDVAKRYTFWPVLFSGTAVWAFALGLFVFGWRKRRARSQATLERWARDEAREDAIRRLREQARVHIVLAPSPEPAQTPLPQGAPDPIEVPRVQHDGQWHTLH